VAKSIANRLRRRLDDELAGEPSADWQPGEVALTLLLDRMLPP
jgi:hypothetical protein